MNCPNCHSEFSPEKIGSTVYWRCGSCGALWFDNKENDFLTLKEAEKLNMEKSSCSFSKLSYSCPRCQKKLSYDHYYYRCYGCGGVLSTSTAILEEQTDKTKDTAAKIPRPISYNQLRYAVVLGALAIFIGLNTYFFKTFTNKVTIQTQAEEITSNVRVQKINKQRLAIYFGTQEPYRSIAIFNTGNRQWQKYINKSLSLNHFLVVDSPKEPTNLTIKLISTDGAEELTAPIDLSL